MKSLINKILFLKDRHQTMIRLANPRRARKKTKRKIRKRRSPKRTEKIRKMIPYPSK